jgi:magnesium transporter
MVMFSKLLSFEIEDKKKGQVKLSDLSVALLESDYPPVTNIFFESGGKFMKLPWEETVSFDLVEKRIEVNDLNKAEEVSSEAKKDYVLVRGEILDALIIDLENRSTFGANDLRFENSENNLELVAVDNSISAILRRISFGFYNYLSRSGLCDWKYVEFLRGDPAAARSGAGYNLRITRLPPGEIAQLASYLPYLHAAELITLLPNEKAVKTLEIMPIERQLQVFEELDKDEAISLLTLMAPDAAADLVGLLQTKTMKEYLELIPKEQSARIVELLRYPEGTAGGIMTNGIAYLPRDLTVAEARERMRERFSKVDFIYVIYIVEDEETRALNGIISLRDLFGTNDEQKLEEIMDPYISTLNSIDDVREASYRVVDSQLPAMPVLGINRKLIGAVTIDAAIMQIAPTPGNEALRIFS